MDSLGILGIFCGAASLSGILLSFYFFLGKNGKAGSRLLLGLLFLAISMRISKSVWHYVFFDYGTVGVIQGYVFLAAIGPALFTYILSSLDRLRKVHLLHFLWALAALIAGILETGTFKYHYMYGSGLVFIYMLLSFNIHHKNDYESKSLKAFNSAIIAGVALIFCSFVFQSALGGLRNYTYGAAFASLVIYFMLFRALSRSLIIKNESKAQVADDILQKVRNAIEKQKIFLQPGITLSNFSSEYDIPSYLVTRSVNRVYSRSFPETINHFRVEEVKRRLKNGDNKVLKIEGIAAESGFSTPSAFYSAFKKETGSTPTQFQKSLS